MLVEPIGPRFGSAVSPAPGMQDRQARRAGTEHRGGTKWYRRGCRSADCGENVTCWRL